MTSEEIKQTKKRAHRLAEQGDESANNRIPLWEIAFQLAVLNERAGEEFRWRMEQTALDREMDASEAAAKASGNETLEKMTQVAAELSSSLGIRPELSSSLGIRPELSSSLGIRPHSGPPCPNCQQYLPAEPGKRYAICGSCYRAVFDDGTFKNPAAEIPKPS
jgi:hypothetical protein